MSMTKFMHPRNIYRTPPNFKQLAIDYPEFRKHVKQEITGKITLDFKDVAALRALTCTLLKKDYDLDVEVPIDKLIPTVPLRLNYVLWVEDLMNISGRSGNVRGIDVGTGASCVYPLIIARKYGWSMIAMDVDDDSLGYASRNVAGNSLDHLISVRKVTGENLLKNVVDGEYDFCMCNPPFFASQQETIFEFKSRKQSRPKPKNAFAAAQTEVVVKGGEVEFISRLIAESKELDQKIRIYTTMIGHKTSLAPLKKLLRECDVVSFKQTEFCQGNTTRWGLAWTYCDIDLRKVPEETLAASRKQKKKNPVSYTLPESWNECDVVDVAEKIVVLFNKLQIDYKTLKQTKNVSAYEITAHSNTWSHQRRKRREHLQIPRDPDLPDSPESAVRDDPPSPNVDVAAELISEINVRSPKKRELDDEDGYYNNKRIKMDDGQAVDVTAKYLEATVVVRKDVHGIHVEFIWEDGTAGKDSLHQVLQYFKNNLK